ncbi:helix-turn-helix domain-containing protein [Streptomyces sp. ICBB 8177]|uniref:helix-turn-helix domain-containing protein n=1 Tax=Streptomyces sp. ICBB 8177 TaxID=563922 RepID=UPI001F543F90|nr:helix-turn-helix domain-containing protein [Streptomyces sp. ICBB 8177]
MTTPGIGRGVLRPDLAARRFELLREEPDDDLAPYVEFHWVVRWDLRGRPAHDQRVLSHPNVHLVFERPETAVHGVNRGVYAHHLAGAGHVFGVKFRPGAFRTLLGGPVAALTDRRVPAADLFGETVTRTERVVLGARDVAVMRRAAQDFLRGVLDGAVPDPAAREAAALVERIASTPALLRVGQLAAESGHSVRSLQRLFAEYVGVPPKWVLRRARLHEAAARADSGAAVDWAALAADLGYADQAHLVRDFTAAVGASPGRYAAGLDAPGAGEPRAVPG